MRTSRDPAVNAETSVKCAVRSRSADLAHDCPSRCFVVTSLRVEGWEASRSAHRTGTIDLIRRMALDNRTWGAERILEGTPEARTPRRQTHHTAPHPVCPSAGKMPTLAHVPEESLR